MRLTRRGDGSLYDQVTAGFKANLSDVLAAIALVQLDRVEEHVADTEQNQPYVRRDRWRLFDRTGDLAIPRGCHARWLLIDREVSTIAPNLPIVYRDARYVLYSVPRV